MKNSYWKLAFVAAALTALNLAGRARLGRGQETSEKKSISLPSSKILLSPAPGHPQPTNSFPTALALSPDGRYVALLNNGRGVEESGYQQSIAIVDLASRQVRDFPDPRLKVGAKQTYFLGLAFSSDGKEIYASIASLNDPQRYRHLLVSGRQGRSPTVRQASLACTRPRQTARRGLLPSPQRHGRPLSRRFGSHPG
jgi:hypothetical protein